MAVTIRLRGKVYSAYWREEGKFRTKSLGKDKRMAKMKAVEIEKLLIDKKSGGHREITWKEFQSKYMRACMADLTEATLVRNQCVFNNINKTIPVRMLADLTPEILEEYKVLRKKAGLQASTINRELTTIKTAMKRAGEWGYVSPNIWGVRKIPTVKKRPVFYTEEDIEAMLKEADPYWRVVLYIGFFAGLRMGEMLNLEWPDIDFSRGIVKVTPSEQWQPKDKEAREIPMHPELENHLKLWKRLSRADMKVLPWNAKKNIFSRNFSRLRKRAGVKKGSVHTLRHSFASHMAMRGVDLNRIREMMGHSSIVTTQIYAHLLPSSLRNAVITLPNINPQPSQNTLVQKNGHKQLPLKTKDLPEESVTMMVPVIDQN